MSAVFKQTALITGASAGIGEAFAREYARRGVDLILIARRGDRLRRLRDELVEHHGISVLVIETDLSDPAAPEMIWNAVSARSIDVDILINNAGYGVPGRLMSSSLQTHRDFQQVMVEAVVALCYLFIPAMRERRRGTIINVASLAGHMPGMSGGHTLYGAAKAWMIKFSESLAFELKPDGISVCALCPGFTYTEFHDVTGVRDKIAKMPGYMLMTAEDVVLQGIEAVERGEIVFINGRVNRLIAILARLLPTRWVYRLLNRRAGGFRDGR